MLSAANLALTEVIKDNNTIGGFEYPTINFIHKDGRHYLTLKPGFTPMGVNILLRTMHDPDEYIIYTIDAPYTKLIYYSMSSIRKLLDDIIYRNTGRSIHFIGLGYMDDITKLRMIGNYSLEETNDEFIFKRKLEDVKFLQVA